MGLILKHHHDEPLGREMFAHAHPQLEPKYSKYPEKFKKLWRDDPQYDTQEKRGKLISELIMEQYALVKENDPDAVCCMNLYGETMESRLNLVKTRRGI